MFSPELSGALSLVGALGSFEWERNVSGLSSLPSSHITLGSAWGAPCTMKCPHPPTSEDGEEEGISAVEGEGEDSVVPTMEAT